jgi:uncharacterized protein YdaU (DUF1376 family)
VGLLPDRKELSPLLPIVSFKGCLKGGFMHYYKRNLGDYAKKAGRLTMLQHGAYTLLIDSCYDREVFPTLEQALEWTWASTEAEVEAVKFVLSRFFVLDKEGCYVQDRILQELLHYHKNADTNKRIADEREAKRRENRTKRTQSVDDAPPNHKPITNNHKPNKESATSVAVVFPDWLPKETWDAFIQMRKRIGKPPTDYAIKLLVAKLERFKANGQDVKQVLEKSITSGWQDVFEIKGNPADNIRLTVPASNEPDKALQKIKADDLKAAPIPLEVLAKMAELRRKA